MKQLPTSFIYKGLEYVRLKRDGMVALVKVVKPTKQETLNYEVWKIQSHDGYEINGVYIEPAESAPSTSTWGKQGWSYTPDEYDRAKAKYSSLIEAEEKAYKKSIIDGMKEPVSKFSKQLKW